MPISCCPGGRYPRTCKCDKEKYVCVLKVKQKKITGNFGC